VRSVVRSAQNTAIASHAPARVRVDRKTGAIRAESMVVVGTYQFEDRSIEGYGPAGEAEPELFDPRGFVGACFRPAGKFRATAEIPLQSDPAFDFALGFAVRLAILRETAAGGRVFTIGASETPTMALELSPNGVLRARFHTRLGDESSDRRGGQVIISSVAGLVPVQRWVEVEMQYDRSNFSLYLDGVLVATQPEEHLVWKVDGPLVLSDPSVPFPGRIDALVLSAMLAGEPGVLPQSVSFTASSAVQVQFAAGGGLDRGVHVDPPRIELEFKDGSRETVTVGLYGTVE
jgi:hypothetical protein